MYKYQHLYLPVLYGLLGLKFRVQDWTDTFMKYVLSGAWWLGTTRSFVDTVSYLTCAWAVTRWNLPLCGYPARASNGAIRVNYYDSWLVRLLAVKAFWITWRVIVPLTVFHVPLGDFAVLFLVAELASGYWLALNFQVGARGLCVCCDV